ncbi:hypothetical protein C8A03DRAFT_37150 [Achaetomium macrosporum]|uniref:Zn(2)-C6 fungal-type domain-containing protein n=1 Tax=Achaetomium macrosporum TaxID=79813 RepID=A0AAN7H4T3_9PEZI|nr:hypothetical protein C8A03DRAFT_37150 [Achaetomium macrosporum]
MTKRRAHKKSRNGCKECKRRHIKCDERWPSCSNCVTTERQCSYLLLYRHTPPYPSPSPASSLAWVDTPAPTPFSAPDTVSESPAGVSCVSAGSGPGLLGEGYSLLHLELFHHFDRNFSSSFSPGLQDLEPLLRLAVREAFAWPYLMDELLAVSAAHKSTLVDDRDNSGSSRKALYRTEATRLQTRAVARLGSISQCEISDENCVSLFLFSIFLGQHALFDVFSSLPRGDLAAVLDRFTHCLGLHRGIRVIASRSWPRVCAQLQLGPEHLEPPDPHVAAAAVGQRRGTECAALVELLRSKSQLTSPAKQACGDAVEQLQRMFDSSQLPGTARRFIVVQEWMVRVSVAYVDLLAERRPEALVILAYYGVLLHHAREYWPVGRAGSYLIRSITAHLGSYWAEWLRWPNSMLDASEPGT